MADYINGAFEMLSGIFLLLNCFKVYKDKQVKGVSMLSTAFFTTWGFWNLYYYPSLNQTASFYGGLLIVSANSLWLGLMWKYRSKNNGKEETETA